MRETGEVAVGGLDGDKTYQERARLALPILVRQAKAGQTMSYGQLAEELGISNPRTLNYPLGAVGNELLDLSEKWGKPVPPIQALVINKSTQLPGEGIAWFAPDAAEFKQAPRRERQRIVARMLHGVFSFREWDAVLAAFGLAASDSRASRLPEAERLATRGDSGESEEHRCLKEAVALNPQWVGLPKTMAPGKTESVLCSGDRIDVLFNDQTRHVAIEVKAKGAPDGELVRGLFQCVKYGALLDAEARAKGSQIDCEARLALGGPLPASLLSLRNTLGVPVHDRLT